MEWASITGLVRALVAAEHCTAVTARIDEGVQLAGAAAGDKDRLTAHRGGEVVVVVRDLALVGEVDPIALEDMLHFEFEDIWIRKDIPSDAVGAAGRIILQGCVERLPDRVEHSFSPSCSGFCRLSGL